MRVIKEGVKLVYRFNCPNCKSRLEAEDKELVDFGGGVIKFFCPVCRKDRYVSKTGLRKRIIYEES